MSILTRITRAIRGNPGLGRVPFWDPRNEKYPIVLPKRALAATRKPKSRRWRAWRIFDQGRVPACTAYGTFATLAADPVRQAKRGALLGDPLAFYAEIQAVDRAEGRFYSEGATGLAAIKAATARGYFSEYQWTLDAGIALAALETVGPILLGTWWYSSMYDTDAEGIIRITPNARRDGGHWFTVGAVDYRRSLVRIHQTWGGIGVQWLPIEDMVRLVSEDAEVCLARELVVPAARSANNDGGDGN